jgi:hypothetical protein
VSADAQREFLLSVRDELVGLQRRVDGFLKESEPSKPKTVCAHCGPITLPRGTTLDDHMHVMHEPAAVVPRPSCRAHDQEETG